MEVLAAAQVDKAAGSQKGWGSQEVVVWKSCRIRQS